MPCDLPGMYLAYISGKSLVLCYNQIVFSAIFGLFLDAAVHGVHLVVNNVMS